MKRGEVVSYGWVCKNAIVDVKKVKLSSQLNANSPHIIKLYVH